MYSIFLVDDEELELEMMRDYIRWEEMGIYVAGTALNGREALEKIQAVEPDIVLTDVQMPIMNGIDLAGRISAAYDWIQLVFLTGHDEFRYVKSALNVGAVGYLLKPLDLGEIVGVMAKVKQKCEEARMKNKSIQTAKANVFKELIYEPNEERISYLISSFGRLARLQTPPKYSLALCAIDKRSFSALGKRLEDGQSQLAAFADEQLRSRNLDPVLVPLPEGELAIFWAETAAPEPGVWEELTRSVYGSFNYTVSMAVNARAAEMAEFASLYEQTQAMLKERFFLGEGALIRFLDTDRGPAGGQTPPFAEKAWFEKLQELEEEEVARLLHEYFACLIQLRVSKKTVCDWCIGLLDRLQEEIHRPAPTGHERVELYQSIYGSQTIQEIESLLLKAAEEAMLALKERFMDRNSKLVHQVCAIIDRSYHEPITINSLSDQVYLSPNYLRTIFKDKTGVTIHDYLTRIRLDKAKELLADPSLKVQDIAQMVGYESTSYFISLFLKNQGVTPNEYRKSL